MTATATRVRPAGAIGHDDHGFHFTCNVCEESSSSCYTTREGAEDAYDRHHDTAHGPAVPEPARATFADQLHDGLLIMGAGIPAGLGINHGVYWVSGEFLPWWVRCGIGVACAGAAVIGLRWWRASEQQRSRA